MRRTAIALLVLAACASANEAAGGDVDVTPSGPAAVDATARPVVTGGTVVDVPDTAAEPTTDSTDAGSQPAGFGSTTATVTAADGTTCELCLWLADTADQRARGLMSVTDLGAADGMAFRYPQPHTGTFWMKDTLLPLSIAFYAPDGEHLGAFDMDPCVTAPCLNYPTPADFLVAVEVPQGELARLGLTAGSRLVLHDTPCVTSGT